MKKYLALTFVFATTMAYAQRWQTEFGSNYIYADPTGGMGRVIDRAHGVTMNFGFITPDNHLSLGLDIGYAQYGRDKSRQVYSFDDGTTADMDIIVSNGFTNMATYARYYPLAKGVLRPYVTAKAGYSFYNTSLNIYDPDDMDHCEPVDSDKLYNDGAFTGSLGVGVKFDLASIFGSLEEDVLFLDMSYSVTQGGMVKYMKTHGPRPGQPHNHDRGDVTAEFINTQTQIVHNHHVGYLYHSVIQMTELRAGFSLHLKR